MDCITHGVAKSQTRLGSFHIPIMSSAAVNAKLVLWHRYMAPLSFCPPHPALLVVFKEEEAVLLSPVLHSQDLHSVNVFFFFFLNHVLRHQ